MAEFKEAIPIVLDHEGGYVNNVHDPGGATKFGISLYWLKSLGLIDLADVNHDGRIDVEDIKALTVDTAAGYYKKFWWDKYNYSWIKNQAIANKLFDSAVNMGGLQAHKIAQRTLTFCGYPCMDDGLIGQATLDVLE
jgi:lysozyme family protein